MTAAFTNITLKSLHSPSFSSNVLQQGCPEDCVKTEFMMDTPPFSSSKLLFLILPFLLIFLPTLPVAASPAGNPSKRKAFKLQVITSVQHKSETCFRVLLEE